MRLRNMLKICLAFKNRRLIKLINVMLIQKHVPQLREGLVIWVKGVQATLAGIQSENSHKWHPNRMKPTRILSYYPHCIARILKNLQRQIGANSGARSNCSWVRRSEVSALVNNILRIILHRQRSLLLNAKKDQLHPRCFVKARSEQESKYDKGMTPLIATSVLLPLLMTERIENWERSEQVLPSSFLMRDLSLIVSITSTSSLKIIFQWW